MLVLTRCIGQSIVIGDNITVSVVAISGDQVRLGITAPRHIPVHRDEIHRQFRSQHGRTDAEPRGRYGERL